MVPPYSHRISRVLRYSGYGSARFRFHLRGYYALWPGCPSRSISFRLPLVPHLTPYDVSYGLGSFPFARRYLGNRCYFLFLQLLRCFSSPGSPARTMCSSWHGISSICRVSTFGHPRVIACLRLIEAFRSLPRPSSALSG